MPYDYNQICLNLVKNLSPRTKDIVSRRFGLKKKKPETLQAIGNSYNITRERVRQIEADGFRKLKPILTNHQNIFNYFQSHIKNWGDLRREDKLLSELGGEKLQNQVFFLLALGDNFQRYLESDEFYTFWADSQDSPVLAKKVISSLINKFSKLKTPLSEEELLDIFQKENISLGEKKLSKKPLLSYLEVSKTIWQNPNDLWGLADWPEINPKGIKDKAYLVFKNQKKPIHFRDVATLINELNIGNLSALPQTVHNELIRDPRFVLVGRGIYALTEWGYEPGVVKDIVLKVLKENKKALTRQEIVDQVLSQRLVKPSTVLANLQDGKMFVRDEEGRYRIKKV